MINKVYILDSNIIIKIWNECPEILENIEKAEGIDFKISNNVAGELSQKEFKDFNGVPVLTNKFMKLLDHIIDENSYGLQCEIDKPFYSIEGNKISKNDYELICICQNNENYILVTEDKRLFNSGRFLLENSKIIGFNEFLDELYKVNIGGQL
ncbi:hypothetical protein KQI86_05630 [Clostridium sp. MSJ-11]|uniref:PIN domain-containing protein n=1 Tax=Clostridium mobile TaxID=2841512 RepID=A0ABS6EHC0_9CLOT|nr:hypothetical protein [Clostridium mobile]MBU5483804.1 hypothetical protein [Clostridium mobile]